MPPTASAVVNVVSASYTNPVRAGYSINIKDILNGLPPDAADDNFNAYDPFPFRQQAAGPYGGEVGDADYYDAAGALLFPVERMRRWVTPADINGTGMVYAYNLGSRGSNNGFDSLGRVEFNSYFRPAGSPGVINTNYTYTESSGTMASEFSNLALGAISFPVLDSNLNALDVSNEWYYKGGPNPGNMANPTGIEPNANVPYPYLPDQTSNPTHGLEQGRFPNQNYYVWNASTMTGSYTFTPQNIGGSPLDVNIDTGGAGSPPAPLPNSTPAAFPSYDYFVNASVNSDGLNDADEMNLYQPNPLYDSPYGPGDLEWLYRQQDVDGAYLSSRLAQLAPISFGNGLDGPRRRRLFALDAWDLNNFAWTNDNPSGAFPTNSRYVSTANAGFTTLNTGSVVNPVTNPIMNFTFNPNGPGVFNPTLGPPSPTPGLAQRDNKINLNYPLPVSNDPDEPIRQKWITDTYQLLKSVLPPKAVDTAEELAALSQYVINIIDFRDTDSTMTHWVNQDVQLAGVAVLNAAGTAATPPSVPPTLILTGATWPPASYAGVTPAPALTTTMALDQYGVEYNPVALNEVLAYSFIYTTASGGAATRANRFFIELVNTATVPDISAATLAGFNPVLDLGGFVYNAPPAAGTLDPYPNGCWDFIIAADDPYSRPDPYRGQLNPYANLFAATPLAQATFGPPTGGVIATNPNNPVASGGTAADGYDVALLPLNYQGYTGVTYTGSIPNPAPAGTALQSGGTSPMPLDYFYVIGNTGPTAGAGGTSYEKNGPGPTTYWPGTLVSSGGQAGPSTYNVPNATTPTQIQTFKPTMDPVTGAAAAASPVVLYRGVIPGLVPPASAGNTNPSTTMPLPPNYSTKLPTMSTATGQIAPSSPSSTNASGYYWVCLRRPANLFAPVSITNPMVVVDSMRFSYLDGTGKLVANSGGAGANPPQVPSIANNPGFSGATVANYPYSSQRYQPFRGGHAVPERAPIGATVSAMAGQTLPVDSRYGYTEQIVVPGLASQALSTQGIYYTGGGRERLRDPVHLSHAGMGQRVRAGIAEQPVRAVGLLRVQRSRFHERGRAAAGAGLLAGSVHEAVRGVAPGAGNVANIFSAVIPNMIPPTGGSTLTISGPQTATGGLSGSGGTPTAGWNFIQPYLTASTPFRYGYDTAGPSIPQPRSYPYLNDEFFYTGYGGAATIDTGGQVGGYAGDGWFKMFEFFEVPSQSIGAIGPVAQGSNFDWLRQDIKHGQLNPNLIIDEEVFFSLAGKQSISQSNGQNLSYDAMSMMTSYQLPSDQFSQQLLNFNQIPGLPNLPYLLGGSNAANPVFMVQPAILFGANNPPPWVAPVPMVVTSALANGTPRTAIPIATNASKHAGHGGVRPGRQLLLQRPAARFRVLFIRTATA